MTKRKPKGDRKVRTQFRKKHEVRRRKRDVTREFHAEGEDIAPAPTTERVSGKGVLSRKKTIVGELAESDDTSFHVVPEVDESQCLAGRVIAVYGLLSHVEASDGKRYECGTRQLLKDLATDDRHVVVAGDRVMIRPVGDCEGMIERVESRRGVLSRTTRGKRHVLVANVDLICIIASVAEPSLKPNLID